MRRGLENGQKHGEDDEAAEGACAAITEVALEAIRPIRRQLCSAFASAGASTLGPEARTSQDDDEKGVEKGHEHVAC